MSERNKPYFLLDIDGVVADFLGAVRTCVAEVSDEPVACDRWDFTADLAEQRPDDYRHYFDHSSEPEFCYSIPLVDGAADFIKRLRQSFRVVAVTSPLSHCPTWESERRRWLRDYLGFEKRDIVFCSDKSHVAGDFLLDDRPENIEEWSKEWERDGFNRGVIWHQPYNTAATGHRLCSFDDVITHAELVIADSDFYSHRGNKYRRGVAL